MVEEKNSTSKTFSRRHGVKKIFSVPVGKLRRNLVSPGRNGSRSKSGSQNTSHRKLLLRNNRDLARALSCEKERFRAVVTENVNLNARLHDTRLSVHGLEKQLCESRESLKLFQRGVMDHLRDAVKHSVSLTESLQLAMGLCYEEPKGLHHLRNTASSPCMPTSSHQPLKLRVNPMVAGLTIRHPTISLRRVVMNRDDRVADGNTLSENVANDNVADDDVADDDAADENVAPSEEESAETVEDISRNMEETRERPGGLSTCLEEDEEGIGNTEMDEKESEEESDEENDSIRRKVVSFRNTTLVKDQSRSGVDTTGEKINAPDETGKLSFVDTIIDEQGSKQKRRSPSSDKQPPSAGKSQSDEASRKNPFVALNDISEYLQNSNSVNVHKVISVLDNSKLRDKTRGKVEEEAENGKENIPKPCPRKKLSGKKTIVSAGVDCRLPSRAGELCNEGGVETLSSSGNEKCLASNDALPAINIGNFQDDPLEGTSWMHLHLFSENKSKKRGRKKKPLKDSCLEASEFKKPLKTNGGKVSESSKEKSSNGFAECEAPVDNDILSNNFTGLAEDYDVSDFDVGLKNCPMAQSTPLNHGKSSKNSKPTNLSDVSKSASKSSGSNSSNNSLVSNESCSSGNNQVKEVDKNLVVPVIDSKLESNAYVTVRIRKLNFPALSPVDSVNLPDLPPSDYVAGNMPEVQRCAELSDEIVNFLGFPASSESEEQIELMKTMIASECEPKSRESSRSCGLESIRSAGVTHDSQMFMASNCEESADNQGRPRRRAAPKNLKEMHLNKKLRRQ
ncbi:uncharacterized protein LOC124171010 isoform X3 [Ischnura elegans]|uniref:uncharacterized protein LOC124171010 isoform X3 n=1 Tax=Ischnura elegans TaxID=197161 RepID=UPI001ED86832|nr:uncharacterized protein LOC124171010 isoform X3 [Ischnura elegans]